MSHREIIRKAEEIICDINQNISNKDTVENLTENLQNLKTYMLGLEECDGTDPCDIYNSCVFEKGSDGFLKCFSFREDTSPFGYAAASFYILRNSEKFNFKDMNVSFGKRVLVKREFDDDSLTLTYLENTFGDVNEVEKFLEEFVKSKFYGDIIHRKDHKRSKLENKYLDFTEKKIAISWSEESVRDIFSIYEFESKIEFHN